MYLALNKLQRLICHKTQPTNQLTNTDIGLNFYEEVNHKNLDLLCFSKIRLIRLKYVLKHIPYFASALCRKSMNPILPIPYFVSAACIL